MVHVDHDRASGAFLGQLDAFVGVGSALTDEELLAASHCRGWTVGDVFVHVHLGIQEMLLGLVTPTDADPDVDAATYWRQEVPRTDPDADSLAGARFVRLLGAAYRRPVGAVAHLRITAAGVATAVRRLRPGAVRFQGHVLSTGDFLATWVLELAVHQLDLGRELDVPEPTAAAMGITTETLRCLAGESFPPAWSAKTTVLVGAGRVALTRDEADAAPGLAARLPVLG